MKMEGGFKNNIKAPTAIFKFTAEEFKAEMDKLIKLGRTEDEAREIVLTEELLVQKKQEMAQKENIQVKDTRYDLGDMKDWAA